MGDRVIVGSCKGTLTALDTRSGEVLWQYDITRDGDQWNFHGDPLVFDNMLVIGTDGPSVGHIYAFDWQSGEVLWKHRENRGVATDILQLDAQIFATTLLDELICLDLYTGKMLWSVPSELAPEASHLNHTPALTESAVFFGGQDGTVRALDPMYGDVLWTGEVEGLVMTSVVVVDGSVVLGTDAGRVWWLDAASGEIKATLNTTKAPFGEIAVIDGLLIMFLDWAQPGTEAVAIDSATRKIAWRRSPPGDDRWTSARPYRVGDDVVVGSKAGLVQAFRARDGKKTWSMTVDGTVRGMRFSGDAAFIGTLGGRLFCIDTNAPGGK